MKIFLVSLLFVISSGFLGRSSDSKPEPLLTWPELQRRAAKFGTVLTLPIFENSAEEVTKSTDDAIAKANSALDAIGRLNPQKITFRNTVRALDDLESDISQVSNRIGLLS